MGRLAGILVVFALVGVIYALADATALAGNADTAGQPDGVPMYSTVLASAADDGGAGQSARSGGDREANLSGIDAEPQAVLIFDSAPVPEPATMAFLASSVLVLAGSRYRRM